MNRLKKTDYFIIAVLLLLIAFITFMAVNGGKDETGQSGNALTPTAVSETLSEPDYTDYNGKRIGILTGSSFEPITLEKFPDSEYFYFDNLTDLIAALLSGKIDAFAEDEPTIKMICRQQKELGYLKKELVDDKYCFGFQKGTERSQKLQSEFNELLSELKASGELDRICEKWFSEDESVKVYDDSELSGENGEIVAWTNPELQPFAYMADGKYKGISIELVTLFARKYGYSIRFEIGNLSSGIAGLTAGKYDILAGAASATEERKESMDFSDSFYDGGISLVVRASDLGGQTAAAPQAVEDRTLGYYADNGKIGAITGGLYEIMIRERYPQAEILQYNSQPDLAIALSEGKIDAFTCPKSAAEDFMAADSSLTYLNEIFMEIPYGFAFKKMDGENKLRDQMNEYLAKIHANGTYDEIVDTWFGTDESKKTVDFTGLDTAETTLRYITASTMQPYSYIKDGQNAGLEIDLVARFCKEYGYGLKIDSADFAGLIPGIAGGTYDIASGNIMITEERAKSVDFSDVYYTGAAVSVVRKEALPAVQPQEETPGEAPEKIGFIDGLKESFNKNFVREDRYKLILEGIGTTCIITLTVCFRARYATFM